jgi:hypothetical protein
MDIKKLTQEVLLKNMTPEQQMAVLDSVQASVKEAKVIQKQKIAENVDLVLQALKRIEADMLKRVAGTAQTVEDRVKTIKDGKDGKNGVDGKQGKDGKDGKAGADGRNGKDGINGVSGERGQDGVGVQDAHIDFDGSLIISLTNGTELNVGEVVPVDVAEKIRVIGNGGGTSQFVLDTLASLQASIDAIPSTLIITDTFVVSSQAAMLALTTAEKGDVAVRTDLSKTFILTASPYSTLGNWQELLTPTDVVTSVAGRTGAVTLSNTDISGLGTMSTQNASSVAITGGTATLTSLTTPTVQATNSAGLALKNSVGTTQLSMGAGGGDNMSINVSTNINGTNAQIDISPTGTGHVHIKPTGVNSVEIAPVFVGNIDNMIIGATTAKAITGTTITATTYAGGNVANWDTAYGWGNHASAGYVVSGGALGTPSSGNLANCTFPTLNQNTTGTASNVTGTVAVANGGTGSTTASAGFNALSPITTTGDLILGNGTNSATRLGVGINGYVLTSNGTTATWAAASGGSALTVKDEGTTLSSAVTSFDFVGAGVVATNTGGAITVTIAGGGGGGSSPIPKLQSWSIGGF